MIQTRINARFPRKDGRKTADASDRANITLRIPKEYQADYSHFVSLVLALHLHNRPGQIDVRLKRLDELFHSDQPDYAIASLAWEAIGRNALPFIKPHFADYTAPGAYYAARTALRLGDRDAIVAIADIADDSQHRCNLLAAKSLQHAADDPQVRLALLRLIDNTNPRLRMIAYYAARTALRLGDRDALVAIAAIADDSQHRCNLLAAKSLQHAVDDPQVRLAMFRLIDNPNPRLRMIAYSALRTMASPAIRSMRLPGAFTLDMVESSAEPFICVWAADKPALVLFGGEPTCQQNIFFESADGLVTINADQDDDRFTIIRKLPARHAFASATSEKTVTDLIKVMAFPLDNTKPGAARDLPKGLGLTFSQIAGIIFELCDADNIKAQFHVHRIEQRLTER